MNILIDSSNLNRTAFDETAAPKYRTNRNRGGLPGLAEFQQQMFTEKEGSSESNSVFGVRICLFYIQVMHSNVCRISIA